MDMKLLTFMILGVCFLHINLNVLVGAQSESNQYKYEWQTRLLNNLFNNYHKGVPPSVGDGPIDVEMTFTLTSFNFIDEANEVASVHGWLDQYWTDPRLKWDPAAYNGTELMVIDKDAIWAPDITLINSGTAVDHHGADVKVDSTGYVLYFPSLQINFVCPMDFTFFPYDKQVCTIKFGSWLHDSKSINLVEAEPYEINEADKDLFRISADFKLEKMITKKEGITYINEYIDIAYEIHLTRISSAYSAKLVLPAVLTGFLILATFLLPPASFEKITLCGLTFVALILQLMYLHDIVPVSGDTILGEYLAFALFLDFFATILAVVSYQVNVKSSQTQQLQKQPSEPSDMMMDVEKPDEDRNYGIKVLQNRLRPLMPYLDVASFILFAIVFIVGLAIILGRRG